MKLNIQNKKLTGEVFAPPSKSYAHRYIIACFLTRQNGFIKNVHPSDDVLATLTALSSAGLSYEFIDGGIKLWFDKPKSLLVYDCNESGSTLRFLLPIISALNLKGTFKGCQRLIERPLSPLIDCLNKNGANIEGLTVNGTLKSGTYEILGNVSSQFITGLLFALPLLNGDSKIVIKGEKVSKNYINLTLDVLKKFSIKIKCTKSGYYVYGNQTYVMPSNAFVEGDFSNGAFMLSAGALGKGVCVRNLNVNSLQGDKRIIDVLRKFGAKITVFKDGYKVEKGNLNGIIYDCQNIPDLVQIISVVSAYASGKTTLKNVSRLTLKESDRIEGILNNLKACGIKAVYDGNDLTIYGGKVLGGDMNGSNDHRTVMSACILTAFASGCSTVTTPNAIKKSYPNFYKDFTLLGGKVDGDI